MDPFTLIQSIVQVSSSCYILSKFIYTLRDDYNKVDEHARSLSRQLQNLSVTLDSIKTHFEQPDTESLLLDSERDANYWANVLLILKDCEKTVGNMESKVNTVRHGDEDGKRAQAKRLMRMYFAQSDVEFYRKEIEGYSNALGLSLHMISIIYIASPTSCELFRLSALATLQRLRATDVLRGFPVIYSSTTIGNRELSTYTAVRLDSLTENVNSAMVMLKKLEKRSRYMSLTAPQSPPTPTSEVSEDNSMVKAENLAQYINSATRIVSSASTIIETQSTRDGGTEYDFPLEVGSEAGDLLPPERKKAIAKWISREDNSNSSSSSSSASGGSVHYPFANSTLDGMSAIGENAEEEAEAENLDVLQNLVKLGRQNFDNEDYAGAQKYLEVAKDMLVKKKAGSDSNVINNGDSGQFERQLAEILDTLADIYRRQRLYEQCYRTLKELEALPVLTEAAKLSLQHDVAEMCLQLDKHAEGREYCETALRGRQSSFGLRNQKTYESVSLMVSILYAKGETALADAYKISLPRRFQSALPRKASSASLATLTPTETGQSTPSASTATLLVPRSLSPPSSYDTGSGGAMARVSPPTVYSGARPLGSSISVASTLYRPLNAPFTEVSVGTFIQVCEHVDALRAASRCIDAGREGVGYLKHITKEQKWSYWEAWDLIEEHVAQFGMNGGAVGRSPLHVLCYCGLNDLVKVLIDRGATVNGRARGSKTALHIAAGMDHNLVRLLVDHGADKEAADKSMWTALHHAAYHGKTECVRVLVETGAKIMARNDRNQTAAMIARSLKKRDIACILDPERGGKVSWFGLGSY